jgi:O-antigen/teichoic acid export membrane protein
MDATEVRRRATAGALLIAVRTAITQIIALAGNIVLARLLVPDDFGAVAFGATLVTVATFFSDGGMGVALIRRWSPG